MSKFLLYFLLLLMPFTISCKKKHHKKNEYPWQQQPTNVTYVKKLQLKLIRQFPHKGDRNYTQGLAFFQGFLYESTGLEGQSSLKKIDVNNGNIVMQKNINDYFAEGITILNGYITQISWKNMKTFAFEINDFKEKSINFTYNTEGWGLTDNGTQFIMSDGSDKIYFRNTATFNVEKEINVNYEGNPVVYLNELEFTANKIYANVYGSPMIYSIDPSNGNVIEAIDCSSIICAQISKDNPENVLNGIAYNAISKTFYLTGKRCPVIYEVVFEAQSL